jgi:PE family
MPLETQGCGQRAVAIPTASVARVAAVRPGRQRAQPRHHDVAGDPLIAWYRRQSVNRSLGFDPRKKEYANATHVIRPGRGRHWFTSNRQWLQGFQAGATASMSVTALAPAGADDVSMRAAMAFSAFATEMLALNKKRRRKS